MKHPFAHEVFEKKYTYVLGIAMVILENGKLTIKQVEYLRKLSKSIDLKSGDLNKILKVAKQYQMIKDKVISILDTPYKKYCFLMELCILFVEAATADEKWIETIDPLTKHLNMTLSEFNEGKEIYRRLVYSDQGNNEEGSLKKRAATSLLQDKVKKYLTLENSSTSQGACILKKGEELIITKDYKVVGMIKVLKGARLIFREAYIEIEAPIHVEGGYLEIKNAAFRSSKAMTQAMFLVKEARVSIENSQFDGNDTTGVWCHIGGELFIEGSLFKNTQNRSCLMLWDCQARIKATHFIKCKSEENSGGAIYTNSNLEVSESLFEECKAHNGAAIYRFAHVIPWVKSKTVGISQAKMKYKEDQMLQLFGEGIDYLPVPKSFKRIAYPIILRYNRFLNCRPCKTGIICAYKSQVVINQENIFDKCVGKNIYYYE